MSATKTAATALLESMKAGGVDYVFANAGTDFAPILEAMLQPESEHKSFPEFVICPHENLAVAMAQGHYLASARAQAVMVHVNVGVANALCGLLNAARDNIAMLFASGRTPVTERGRTGSRDNFIHWGQEMFDQAAMIREAVKWDYELRYPEQTAAVVARALAIANSEPRGPVYVSLPREVLAQSAAEARPGVITAASAPQPDPEAIKQAATLIAAADNPLIITARSGRTDQGVAALGQLAEQFAIPVVEFAANYMCLPGDHPMHAGVSPAPRLKTADLVLVVDAAAPWPPSRIVPPEDCPIIHLGPDPLFEKLPFRGFRSDLSIAGETAHALESLTAALADEPGVDPVKITDRRKRLTEELAAERKARLAKASAPGAQITHDYASHCISEALGVDGILVNERGCLREAMTFTKPGTFFGPTIAGGLGAGIGTALGIKLARPDRLVAAALGDGSCIFNNPVACLQVSAARELPLLIAVMNNRAWDSVRASSVAVYPGGATSRSNAPPLTSLSPSPDYAAIARACGAEGASVADPAALPAALQKAVEIVQTKEKTVLLDIQIEMS